MADSVCLLCILFLLGLSENAAKSGKRKKADPWPRLSFFDLPCFFAATKPNQTKKAHTHTNIQ